jgi:hypothetical protein
MRKPIGEKPMSTVERRQKSDAEKVIAGECRLTTWITADANKALTKLKKSGGSSRDIVSKALINLADQEDDNQAG